MRREGHGGCHHPFAIALTSVRGGGLPSDVTIEIGGTSFNLHKFPLISRSGLFSKIIGDSPNEDGPIYAIHLNDIPGGAKVFELIARFCYDVKLEVPQCY
ncbi:putative chromatin remodeling & transcription regulator BTB-POZ family [Helianthus debilis subsp. tardiflorus]